VIRAFLRSRSESDRFDRANTDITDSHAPGRPGIRSGRLLSGPAITNLSSVGVVWFGGKPGSEAGRCRIGKPDRVSCCTSCRSCCTSASV